MTDLSDPTSLHYTSSVLRERIVEHVFVGECLRRLWQLRVTDVEVLRSEFDAAGYDLVMCCRGIVRHIQFKTAVAGGHNKSVKVALKLMEKPSGCVIWIIVTPELELNSFLWFGAAPGAPLYDITGMNIAKHTKGNALGIKTERRAHRLLRRTRFDRLDSLDEVLTRLFGPFPRQDSTVRRDELLSAPKLL